MKSPAGPPRPVLWMMDRMSRWGDDDGAAGDFEEFYRELEAEWGTRFARRACWRQAVAALPGYLKNVYLRSDEMLKHFLKVAFRNLRKHKGYSFINIAGLAVGIAGAAFILLWVQDEGSFDRFHSRPETLFRVEQDLPSPQGPFHIAATPFPLAPAVKGTIPEIADATRYLFLDEILLRRDESAFYEKRIRAVDDSFFRMFNFPLVQGDALAAFARSESIVLTQTAAKKYFGDADPLGGRIIINNSLTVTVTGILADLPGNSTLTFDGLIPLDLGRTLHGYRESWSNNNPMTFIRLHAAEGAAAAVEKMTRLIRSRTGDGPRPESQAEFRRTVALRPMADIRLRGYFGNHRSNAVRKNLQAFATIAVFVLLTACLNFMSLATARSAGRAKEVGLRKVMGARRNSLVGQFFGESFLSAGLAGLAALALILLLFPAFRALSGKAIETKALAGTPFLLGILAIILFTGFIAGSYPALLLSSFRPAQVLKGGRRDGVGGTRFRRILVVSQFGLAIILMVGLGVVTRQIGHMKARNLGYDKEQLIYLPMRAELGAAYPVLRGELLKSPRVIGVTATHQEPTAIGSNAADGDWEGKDANAQALIGFASVDYEYTETLRIPLVAGRAFSRDSASDLKQAFLVNEEMLKLMRLPPEGALGRRFALSGISGPIIGIMKDFHFQSVRSAIEPFAVFVDPSMFGFAIVRLRSGNIPSALADVQSAWRRVHPQFPFEYRFFDQDFEADFRADERTGAALKAFALTALFISCLGLYGLASFMAERKKKEIAIRKVLGASSRSIVFFLSREFARWILAANLFAWPIAFFFMGKWLQGYAYRTNLAWWLFPAAGAATLAVALTTVSFQAIRAARAHPAAAMRSE